MKNTIAFTYANGLSIAPKDDAQVGGGDSTVVIEINLTDARSYDYRHVRTGVIPVENGRRAS